MLLAINSGNTNASFAVYDGDKQRGRWRISTDPRRTADEYGVWLSQLMGLKGLKPGDIDGAIIASVVPDALFNLKTLVRSYFNCNPLVIGDSDGNRLGIKAAIDRPEEAGADRLVNAYAAHQRYGGPAIVVDFGTATTFDIVDKDGAYAGGVIAPGINLSLAGAATWPPPSCPMWRSRSRSRSSASPRCRPCNPASSGAMSV